MWKLLINYCVYLYINQRLVIFFIIHAQIKGCIELTILNELMIIIIIICKQNYCIDILISLYI